VVRFRRKVDARAVLRLIEKKMDGMTGKDFLF
jgi:hypothetical protein